MQRSEKISTLAAAIVTAQAKIKPAVKDSTNPHYKSAYADLASVMDACKESLNANDIAVVQASEPSDAGQLKLETILIHKSGEWISGTMTMPLPKNDPQGYGSAMTYARRYGLAAMVGVCPEDDDGNAASGKNTQQRPQQAQQTKPASSAVFDFAAYGDLMDDEIFNEQFLAACDSRKFDDTQTRSVQTAVCKKHKVPLCTMLPVQKKFELIKAVRDGIFDPKPQAKAS